MATIWTLFLDIVDACCSLTITKADIDSMHSKIVTFILMIQGFFGKQHVTYLMHQLLHYPAIIHNFGTYCASSRSITALWLHCLLCSSSSSSSSSSLLVHTGPMRCVWLFAFERLYRTLRESVTGTGDAAQQTVKKHMLAQALWVQQTSGRDSHDDEAAVNVTNTWTLYDPCPQSLSDDDLSDMIKSVCATVDFLQYGNWRAQPQHFNTDAHHSVTA